MKQPVTPVAGRPACPARGFTLIELLVVLALIAVLTSLLLPALAKARAKGQGIYFLNNVRQLTSGWLFYTHDNGDRLPYHLGATEIKRMLAVSAIKRQAGWTERARSVSMNAMVGDAGEFTRHGTNVNNPSYRQFLKRGEIAAPSGTFVLIEEHPDSINDSYFLNRASASAWTDLPASYHNGSANLSFADGHGAGHRWVSSTTRPPPRPDAAALPFPLGEQDRTDFSWLLRRTSLYEDPD